MADLGADVWLGRPWLVGTSVPDRDFGRSVDEKEGRLPEEPGDGAEPREAPRASLRNVVPDGLDPREFASTTIFVTTVASVAMLTLLVAGLQAGVVI